VNDVARRRPLSIVILCTLAVIGTVLGAASVPFMQQVRALGAWYLTYLAFATVVGLGALWGYFQMKRAGVVVYACLTLVNQIMLVRFHWWAMQSLMMPLIVLSVGLWNWKDMD
jgi:hypothetical protein